MKVKARSLKAGMVVVCQDTGRRRTVRRDAVPCRAAGYVRAETDGEPVNCHGDTEVSVAAGRLEWFENYGEVCAFARVLVEAGLIETAQEAVRYFEKPWNWSREKLAYDLHKTVSGERHDHDNG